LPYCRYWEKRQETGGREGTEVGCQRSDIRRENREKELAAPDKYSLRNLTGQAKRHKSRKDKGQRTEDGDQKTDTHFICGFSFEMVIIMYP